MLVCHKGNPIYIAPAAVKAHLIHHPEDNLGDCTAQPKAKKASDAKETLAKVQVFPNPFTTRTAIAITLPQTQEYTLQIFDLGGNLIQQWTSAKAKAGSLVRVDWEPKRSGGGIYILRLTTQHNTTQCAASATNTRIKRELTKQGPLVKCQRPLLFAAAQFNTGTAT